MGEMTIRFPDGTARKMQYPEGATREEIIGKANQVKTEWMMRNSASPAEQVAAEQLFGTPERFDSQLPEHVQRMPKAKRADVALIGGMANVARQLGNIAGIVPDYEVERHKELMAPLHETPSGQIGRVGGELLATAPLAGGLVGAGARAGAALFPAMRGWSTAGGMRSIGAGAATGAAEGAIEGALLGGPGQRAQGAALGAATGGAVGGLLPFLTRGFVRPTPEARTLMDQDIDITTGQMSPQSAYSQLEQQSMSFAPTKALMTGARERPQEQITELFINQSTPQDYGRVTPGEPTAMLEEAYEAFRPAYDRLKNFLVNAPESGALRQVPPVTDIDAIADDIVGASDFRRIAASPDTRKAVRGFLEDQAGRLQGEVRTGDLIDIRSAIRDEARNARFGGSPDMDKARLLDQAEVAITRHINKHIPDDLVEYNRALDRRYSNYKIAEKAIFKSKNREFPTMQQWTQAVQESTPYGEFARGGGQFRDIIKAAQRSFRMTDPPTGQRLLNWALLGGLGGGGYQAATSLPPEALAAMALPAAFFTGTPAGRKASAGMLRPQRAAQELVEQWPGTTGAAGVMARGLLPVYTSE